MSVSGRTNYFSDTTCYLLTIHVYPTHICHHPLIYSPSFVLTGVNQRADELFQRYGDNDDDATATTAANYHSSSQGVHNQRMGGGGGVGSGGMGGGGVSAGGPSPPSRGRRHQASPSGRSSANAAAAGIFLPCTPPHLTYVILITTRYSTSPHLTDVSQYTHIYPSLVSTRCNIRHILVPPPLSSPPPSPSSSSSSSSPSSSPSPSSSHYCSSSCRKVAEW